MRRFTMTIAAFLFVGITGLALANPSMLPKHPGYPSGGEFANDRGQQNLTYNQSILEAAKSGDTNMAPPLMDPNNARVLEHGGAGQLPVVEGPKIKIEPPVKEGTRMSTK
jgi:hypothetical protein